MTAPLRDRSTPPTTPRRRRDRRRGAGSAGGGRGARKTTGQVGGRLSGVLARALLAAATAVADDLRKRDGLTRPLLRRCALRLAASPRQPVRQLGSAYLRLDPPAMEEPTLVAPVATDRPALPAPTQEETRT